LSIIAYPYTTKYKTFLIEGSYCEADEDVIAQTLDDVLACYDEPHRAYHTREHLEEMFSLLDEIIELYGLSERETTIAALSIFYHDIVYQTNSVDVISKNEQRSAQIADGEMRVKLAVNDRAICDAVETIIIATKDHSVDPEQNPVGALVIDIDMAILGSDKDRYEQYKGQIRKEFSTFSDVMFYQARRDHFLYPSVRKPRLFLTDSMQDRFGDQAKENMFAEIAEVNRTLPRQAPSQQGKRPI